MKKVRVIAKKCLEKFVLAKFSHQELEILKEVTQKAYEAFEIWLECGIIEAQSKYNGLVIKNG